MAYHTAMDAMGDPTRRAIVERLHAGPRAVGELAEELPVSRPAVSQHLRVLREAGLVTERRAGARRVYRLDPAGLAELRGSIDRLWTAALEGFKDVAESDARERSSMSTNTAELAVRKTITVAASIDSAFATFTERIEEWWPLASYSVGQERAEAAFLEGRVGGRVYERMQGGEEAHWAEVLAWEPPHRLVLAWRPNPAAAAPTEVEVRFAATGPDETRVELEHRGWERLGAEAAEAHASYDGGWDGVLDLYREAAGVA